MLTLIKNRRSICNYMYVIVVARCCVSTLFIIDPCVIHKIFIFGQYMYKPLCLCKIHKKGSSIINQFFLQILYLNKL